MPPIQIRKAERFKSKLRLGLAGPSGAGKTMSALKLAHGIAPKGHILMIDTERGSGDLYAHMFDYDIITLMPPYKPQNYIDAIKAGVDGAYDVIIIDSLTHAWSDEGGLLDQADKKSQSGNRFTVWAELTPQHRALVNAMLNAPCHIIATVRSKQDYAMEKDEKTGRTSVKKMGMAPVQREGMEYEFTTFMDIDMGHFAKTSKDRTDMFKDEVFLIDEKTGQRFNEWLNSGRDNPQATMEDKRKQIANLIKELGMHPKTADETRGLIFGAIGVELIEANYDKIIEKLKVRRDQNLKDAVAGKQAPAMASPDLPVQPATEDEVKAKMDAETAKGAAAFDRALEPKASTQFINLFKSLLTQKFSVPIDSTEMQLSYLADYENIKIEKLEDLTQGEIKKVTEHLTQLKVDAV